MKFILLLVLLVCTSCRTAVEKPRVQKAHGGISEARAVRIAIDEFEKHLLPLWSHDIFFREKEDHWEVVFVGWGRYGGQGSVHVVFVYKDTGKASFVPGI